MKKILGILFGGGGTLIIILAVICFFKNPDQEKFEAFIQKKDEEKKEAMVKEKKGIGLLTGLLGEFGKDAAA
ncbi:MAG: hypothetical protein ACYTFG_04665, partial [Planctomycetota bacterium]